MQRFVGLTPGSNFDRYWRSTLFGIYLKDDVRAHSNLVLNSGVRYEYATVPLELGLRDSTLRRITDADPTPGPPFRHTFWVRFAPRVRVRLVAGRRLTHGPPRGVSIYYDTVTSSRQIQFGLKITF